MNSQTLKPVQYSDGLQKLTGLVTANSGKNLPGVLILPAWKGIDDESKNTAELLAKEGYLTFIADIYGDGNVPADNAAASKIASSYKNDHKAYQHRITLALDELKKAGAEKVVVIGYCFGGTGALEAARANLPVEGVVSIHGGLGKSPDRPNIAIAPRILIQHPAADKSVSKEDYDKIVVEMNEGQADWQIITYANCGHTFTNPDSKDYNPIMAKRAEGHLLMFLNELLK